MQFWKVFVYNVESRFLFLSNVSINLKATSLSYGQWIFGQSLPENIFNILTMNVIWLLNTMSKYIFTDPCKFSCNLVNEWKMTISFSYYPQNQYKLYLTSLRLDWTNFLNRIFTHITELRAKERTNNLVAIWKLNVWCGRPQLITSQEVVKNELSPHSSSHSSLFSTMNCEVFTYFEVGNKWLRSRTFLFNIF